MKNMANKKQGGREGSQPVDGKHGKSGKREQKQTIVRLVEKYRENEYAGFILKNVISKHKHITTIKDWVEKSRITPTVLEIHPSLACKCSCIFCYLRKFNSASNYKNNGRSVLTLKDYISIINTAYQMGLREFNLAGGYEPLLYPHIIELIKEIPEGAEIKLYTSGISDILQDDRVLDLLVSRLSQIRFSINAGTREIYSIVQMKNNDKGKDFFDRLPSIVQKCVEIRDRLIASGKKAAKIGVSFLVVEENIGDLEVAISMWDCYKIDFMDIGNDFLDNNPNLRKHCKAIENNIRTKNMILNRSRPGFRKDMVQSPVCYSAMMKIFLDPYGSLYRCCISCQPGHQKSEYKFGEIRSGNDFYKLITESRVKDYIKSCQCLHCSETDLMSNMLIHELLQGES